MQYLKFPRTPSDDNRAGDETNSCTVYQLDFMIAAIRSVMNTTDGKADPILKYYTDIVFQNDAFEGFVNYSHLCLYRQEIANLSTVHEGLGKIYP